MIDAEYEELDGAEGELDLADTDNLPWLESDEEDEDAGGLDTGQIFGFAALLIVLLAAVVGAVWYVSSRTAGSEAVADGSVIAAPAGPIKERPRGPRWQDLCRHRQCRACGGRRRHARSGRGRTRSGPDTQAFTRCRRGSGGCGSGHVGCGRATCRLFLACTGRTRLGRSHPPYRCAGRG